MRGLGYAAIFIVACLGSLAAKPVIGLAQQATNQLVSPYDGLVDDHQQGTHFGWVPRIEQVNDNQPIKRTYSKREQREREVLRKSYSGCFDTGTNPYENITEETFQTSRTDGTKNEFPEVIMSSGDADKLFCVMISASWCTPCKRMYQTINELRKEGYIFFVFDIENDDYKHFDAKFKASSVPTFIIFNKGSEVVRTVGITKKKWFRDQLKTRDKQNVVVNPYDEI